MLIFRSNFSVFLSFNTQLTHLNASNLLNFDPSNRFLPIASQSWCSGVSKMATYIYIYIRDKSKACLMRALLWFIGIPCMITLGMIRFVMKVCHNASLT